MNIVKLGLEKQPKLTKAQPIVNFFNFFKDSQVDSNKIFSVILKHIEVLSETPYDSIENLYSFFTLCGGFMCAMTLTSYGWDLRIIAKTDQGKANCEFFQFFKNCRNDSNEVFYSHFTLYGQPLCAMRPKS